MKKIMLILGMHRSGTSLISRAMKVFGANHGNKLLKTNDNQNKKGHWEDLDVMNCNRAILTHLGQSWENIEPFTDENFANLHNDGYFDATVDLMKRKLADTDFLALKEPRITKLLPFWKEVFKALNVKVHYVFATRHPFSVAQSLQKRNQYSLEYGMYLWYSYNLFSLKSLENEKVFFINYDDFLERAPQYINELSTFFNEQIIEKEKELFLTDFIDKNLRSFNPNDISFTLNPAYIDFFNLLKSFTDEEIFTFQTYTNYLNTFEKLGYSSAKIQNEEIVSLQKQMSAKDLQIQELQSIQLELAKIKKMLNIN